MNRRKSRFKFSKFLKFFVFFVITILFILFIYFCFRFLTIKQIEIGSNQTECINNDQLKNASGLYGQNFLLMKKDSLIRKLKEKFICVSDLNVSVSSFNKVKLDVISRSPKVKIIKLNDKLSSPSAFIEQIATPSAETSTKTYLADDEGIIFSVLNKELDIPTIYLYNSEISLGTKLGDPIKNAITILDKIRTFGIEAKEGWVSGNILVINLPNNPPQMIFKLDEKIDVQLASLQLILAEAKINSRTIPTEPGISSSKLELIDLRFDKPVVRFAPKERNGER